MKLRIHGERLLRELDELAAFTDCPAEPDPRLPMPQRAVTRIVFTARDLQARRWLQDRVEEAGFLWRKDAVGNTFIRWAGADPALPPIATGSHMDAIPYAGMYDGTVGVLGGLEAMRALREAGFSPQRSIELILFTSEEPTRFGIGCLGSRLLSGALSPAVADQLPDRLRETDTTAQTGGTLREVREAAGFPGSLEDVPLPPGSYAGFVELHIEQGPLLEREGVEVGIVTHIAGPATYRLTLRGVGGHAGALLMPDRRDALCAAAEVVLAVERLVNASNATLGEQASVATVGKLDLHPAAVNAVPSRATLMLDVRSTQRAARESIIAELRSVLKELTERRAVQIDMETLHEDSPTVASDRLLDALKDAAVAAGASSRRMISRAYHDASFMAQIAPVAMVFVPCRGGVSHRPDEYAAPKALVHGTEVLARALAALAGKPSETGWVKGLN